MSPNGPFANDPQHYTAADGGDESTDGTHGTDAENGSRSSPGEDGSAADDGATDETPSTSEPGEESDAGPAAGHDTGSERFSTSNPLAWGEQTLEPGAPVPPREEPGGSPPQWLSNWSSSPDPDDPTLQSRFPDRASPPPQPPTGPPPVEPDTSAVAGDQPEVPSPQPLPDPVASVETGPITSPAPRSPLAALPSLSSLRRPSVPRPPRHRARTPVGDGRVVNERIRHIAPRSVLKISAIFYSCVALALLVATALVWSIARTTGTVEDVESFVTQLFTYGHCVSEDELELGEDFRESDQCPSGVMVGSFEIDDGALFRSAFLGAVLFVIAATIGTVFMVLLFNLLSDLTGGVRYSIVREPAGTSKSSTGGGGRR